MKPTAGFQSGGGTGVLVPPRPDLRSRKRRRPDRSTPPPQPPGDFGGGDDGGRGRPDGPGDPDNRDPGRHSPKPGSDLHRFALVLAMAGISSFFAVFLMAWLFLGRDAPGSKPAGVLDQPWQIWLSTLVLVASSWTITRARGENTRRMLLVSLLLGLAFLGSQALLWNALLGRGFVAVGGGTMSTFYAVTILHALHVLGGLFTMARTLLRLRRGHGVAESIRLCATYWHFMGVVWVVIFAAFGFCG